MRDDVRWRETLERFYREQHKAEIVNLADDREHVGKEVERRQHIGEAEDWQRLQERRDARLAQQTSCEADIRVRRVRKPGKRQKPFETTRHDGRCPMQLSRLWASALKCSVTPWSTSVRQPATSRRGRP